jgi:hypothetical protein
VIHNPNPGPYMKQLSELLDAMERWNYARDVKEVARAARMRELFERLPEDFTVHLDEEIRKCGDKS